MFINSRRLEILPCNTYKKLKKTYVVLDSKSRRYRECIRRSFARYDVSSIPARSLAILIKEEEKLKLEREAAFCLAIKSIARIDRL